jgi:hypothetical protein
MYDVDDGTDNADAAAPVFDPSATRTAKDPDRVVTEAHQKGTTSYLAQVRLTPAPRAAPSPSAASSSSTQREPLFKLDELWLVEIVLSDNDRPPTRFDSQRSHTVAWTLLRRQLSQFRGRSLKSLVDYLGVQFSQLEAVSAAEEEDDDAAAPAPPSASSGPAGVSVAERGGADLANGLAELGQTGVSLLEAGALPLYLWQTLVGNLIRSYVQAYQLSPMATFANGKPTGRGEGRSMSVLEEAEQRAAAGHPVDLARVVQAAGKLIDVAFNPSLPAEAYAHAVHHWATALVTTYPQLTRQHGDAMLSPIFSKALPPGVAAATVPGNVADLLHHFKLVEGQPFAATMHKTMTAQHEVAGGLLDPAAETAVDSYPMSLRIPSLRSMSSGFIASVDARPRSEVGTQQGTLTGSFAARGPAQTTMPVYTVGEMEVRRLALSDLDRPDTRFETQQSHTVAWTLIREQMGRFGGRSLADLVGHVQAHLPASAPGDVGRLLAETRAAVTYAAANPMPAHLWHQFASDLVASYMTLHQRAPSTTYVNMSTLARATGHAEGVHMAVLREADRAVADSARVPYGVERVVAAAVALLDIHSGESSLPAESGRAAFATWEDAMAGAFPALWPEIRVLARNQALAAPSPVDGQTVQAWTGLQPG